MQKFELFDETFDPFRTESYELSIQVSLNGFSFCVKDLTRNLFIALVNKDFDKPLVFADDWMDRMDWFLNLYEWIKKPFKKVVLCYESPKFTLVPQEYFIPEKAKQILTLSHIIDDLEEIRHHNIGKEISCIFSIPSSLTANLLKTFPNLSVISAGSTPLSFHLLKNSIKHTPQLTIAFYNRFAAVNLSHGDKLLHSGTVKLINSEDTVYHLVNICKQFNISPAETEITQLSCFANQEDFSTLLKRFFKSLKLEDSIKHSHFSYQLSQYKTEYINLFNLSLCE
jgi:hypothetical protein